MSYSKENPTVMECGESGCENTHDSSYRYAVIQAHANGWFSMMDGSSWCPKHNPEWVKEWRAKKALRENNS